MISYCMMHVTSDMLAGEAIRALAEQVQMEMEIGTSFVQLPFEKFDTCTNETWLKMMWKNLGSLDIELLWSYIPYLPLHIEGDICIMAEFYGLCDMDKRTIRILNRLRMSMEMYAMSDLATGNGLSIQQDMVAAFTAVTE